MKKGILLNLVAHYPVAELHAAQKDKLNDDSRIYCLGKDYKYTNANPFGRKAIKNYEMLRAKSVAEFLDKQLIEIPFIKNPEISTDDLQKIENAVMSSIASMTRLTSRFELDSRWLNVYLNWVETSKSIFKFFENEFADGLDEILVFNGRMLEDGAARTAAISANKNYRVYDFQKGGYYEYHNTSLHSVDAQCERALRFYLDDPKKAHKVADEFVNSKLEGKDTYERSYTKLQQKNKINVPLDRQKKIISIFPSSDDEYRFLGGDWGAPIVNQVDEILSLAANLDQSKYEIVVRMHPNMSNLSKPLLDSYKKLQTFFPHCHVIDPDDVSSTYTLIDISDIVLCFCSTVAVEANYFRKLVVNIGGSPYYNIPISNYFNNAVDAAKAIKANRLKLKSKRASAIWINFLWKYQMDNPYINIGIRRFSGGDEFKFKIDQPYLPRLLAAPWRAEIQLRVPGKKNLNFLRVILVSVKDVLLNSFSIKS